MEFQDGLRHDAAGNDALAALRASTTILSGVGERAAAVLEGLGIRTVFDLATSPLFAVAQAVAAAGEADGSTFARLDLVPGSVADDGAPTRPAALAAAPLSALRAIDEAQAAQIQDALGVNTVGDLGRWLPFRFARLVLDAAVGPPAATTASGEAPELVPRFGQFPTERRYYRTIVMDRVSVGPTQDLATAGAVDIAPTLAADFGFSAPAVGARLTFQQSWFAHGITLGNLLHSVALAPGESTRIAVLDWSRQVRASGREDISETEALTNSTTHNRALSEVQEAVANEVQTGRSETESSATTASAGLGFGLSLGPVAVGGSGGVGHTTTSASSFSTSSGSRDLAASMSQQVMDKTQQAASSARNRRASIVKEVSEVEHEQVSTRILANYNHMHALTIQYYEVVEVYRVSTGLHEAERCLFVPMKLVDFDEATIIRYQSSLAAGALTRRARELLGVEFGMVPVRSVAQARLPVADILGVRRSRILARPRDDGLRARRPGDPVDPADPTAPPTPPLPPVPPIDPTPGPFEWDVVELHRATRITGSPVIRDGVDHLMLPRDATIAGVSLQLETAAPGVTAVTARLEHGRGEAVFTRTSIGFRAPADVTLDDLQELVVTAGAGTGRARGRITLEVTYRGALFPVTLPIDIAAGTSGPVVRVGAVEAGPELVEHLRQNRLHYNQAIWRSLDASTVALLLSRFSFEGQPVADLIDPHPIQMAGNYLVFRMPGFVARGDVPFTVDADATGAEAEARRRWASFLVDRGLVFDRSSTREQLVPIPTGGVFAEAVLGRSNSAEKLDATRFWNWQDSPIPLQPPEIAAINMQSRAQPIDVTPGQLGQPVLNIVNPTALPDPSGLGAMMGALQNGSMFRDMSGLAATVGLAQASGNNATSANAESQRLAAANLAVAAQKDVEMERTKAAVAAAGTSPSAMQGTPKNVSEMGALLNTAQALDGNAGAGGARGASGGGTTGPGGEVAPGGSPRSGGEGGAAGAFLQRAMDRATFGQLGESGANLILAKAPAPGSGGAGGTGPAQFLGERFFHQQVIRLAITEAAEVTQMQDRLWSPASRDFRAVCHRSNGNRDPGSDAEVATLDAFLAILDQPYSRFNFVSYFEDDTGLQFKREVHGAGSIMPDEAGMAMDAPDRPTLSITVVTALREVVGLSTSPLGRRLGAIRKRNADFRKQHPNAKLRELYLYLTYLGEDFLDQPPTHPYAEMLASLLQMRVHVFPGPIRFNPEFQPLQPTPGVTPKVLVRGQYYRVWAETDAKLRDLHLCDGDSTSFDP